MPQMMTPSFGRTEPWVELDPGQTLPPDVGEAAFEKGRALAMQESYEYASVERYDGAGQRAWFWGFEARAWDTRLRDLLEERGCSHREAAIAHNLARFVMEEFRV